MHQFHCVNGNLYPAKKIQQPDDYSFYHRKQADVQLHDDLIHYMLDTLVWIPTHNPVGIQSCKGLCLYGWTFIQLEGAEIAKNIFQAWVDLFLNGSDILELRAYTVVEDGKEHYEPLRLPRDETVAHLRALVDHCQTILDSNGQFYILHLGI